MMDLREIEYVITLLEKEEKKNLNKGDSFNKRINRELLKKLNKQHQVLIEREI
jgi:hypothetical protein